MNLAQELKKIENDIIKWRRDLHKIAEVGLILPKTEAYIKQELDKMNIEYKLYSQCSGISAVIGKKENKVVGLRADIDALPIKEESGCDFACEQGTMHACGHDAHAAMLLGVAKVLKENEDELNGKVKLIFQPGEEYDAGAKVMIDQGVLENPKVDAVFAQHIMIASHLPIGMILVKDNQLMASSDNFYLKVKGLGGHAAMPEVCIDSIVMATQVINNIYTMISREISPLDSVCISIVNVKSEQPDRVAYNIIPNYVEIVASVRCLDEKLRNYIDKRVGQIAKSTVEGMRGTCEYTYNYGYPALVNAPEMVSIVENSAKELFGPYGSLRAPKGVMGSEDAAYFLEKVPGAYFGTVVGDLNNEGYYPAHHPKMQVDESGLIKGAMVLLQSAVNYLNK
ncbi:M20 family metallopeptidase [Terrisporobacter petrolearius]|uniref:M20 metallopeptidase family protein n=1 Tax=Terrisporobacter petrolearius TaxID=1460447 RepID=UPI0031CC4374